METSNYHGYILLAVGLIVLLLGYKLDSVFYGIGGFIIGFAFTRFK